MNVLCLGHGTRAPLAKLNTELSEFDSCSPEPWQRGRWRWRRWWEGWPAWSSSSAKRVLTGPSLFRGRLRHRRGLVRKVLGSFQSSAWDPFNQKFLWKNSRSLEEKYDSKNSEVVWSVALIINVCRDKIKMILASFEYALELSMWETVAPRILFERSQFVKTWHRGSLCSSQPESPGFESGIWWNVVDKKWKCHWVVYCTQSYYWPHNSGWSLLSIQAKPSFLSLIIEMIIFLFIPTMTIRTSSVRFLNVSNKFRGAGKCSNKNVHCWPLTDIDVVPGL